MKYIIFLMEGDYSKLSDNQKNLILNKIATISLEIIVVITNKNHHSSGIDCLLDRLGEQPLSVKIYQELNLSPEEENNEFIFKIVRDIFTKNDTEWKSVICLLSRESIIKYLNLARSMDKKNLAGEESVEKLILGNIGVIYFDNQNNILQTCLF